jgi:hypothetical protein
VVEFAGWIDILGQALLLPERGSRDTMYLSKAVNENSGEMVTNIPLNRIKTMARHTKVLWKDVFRSRFSMILPNVQFSDFN